MLENARVKNIVSLGAELFRIGLHSPRIAKISRPAHFVMVRTSPGISPLLCRPFSIYQSNTDGTLEILFRRLGPGTTNISRLRPRDEVQLTGPLGTPFDLGRREEYILIAGGVGIAPIFMAAKHLQRHKRRNLTVIAGAATAAEIHPLIQDFKDIDIICDITTVDGSAGHKGLVTDLITPATTKHDMGHTGIICCGPTPMMAAVAARAADLGIECQVSLETMMACGISACLGCAVAIRGSEKYFHVCKDGPVFRADEIEWDRLRD